MNDKIAVFLKKGKFYISQKNLLKMDSGDTCTVCVNVLNATKLYTLKMAKMVKLYTYFAAIKISM